MSRGWEIIAVVPGLGSRNWCRCPVVPSWVAFHIPWPRSSMACADLQPPNLHLPSLSSFGELFNVISLLLTPNFPQKQLQVIRNQERHFNHKILTSQESLFVFGPFLPFFFSPHGGSSQFLCDVPITPLGFNCFPSHGSEFCTPVFQKNLSSSGAITPGKVPALPESWVSNQGVPGKTWFSKEKTLFLIEMFFVSLR